jgi:hypothetical protein
MIINELSANFADYSEHGFCDFGSQGCRFEPCRVQNKYQSRLAGDFSSQIKRTEKYVSQSLASFEVQIAANRAFPGVRIGRTRIDSGGRLAMCLAHGHYPETGGPVGRTIRSTSCA